MISQISKFQGPITQKLVQNFTFTVLKVCYTANAASLKLKQACSYETSDGDGAAVLAPAGCSHFSNLCLLVSSVLLPLTVSVHHVEARLSS